MIKYNNSKFKIKGDGYRELTRSEINSVIKELKTMLKSDVKDDYFFDKLESADQVKVKLDLEYTFKPKTGSYNTLKLVFNVDGFEFRIVEVYKGGPILRYEDKRFFIKSRKDIIFDLTLDVLSWIPLNYNKSFEVEENA